jgi:hypothetical protein
MLRHGARSEPTRRNVQAPVEPEQTNEVGHFLPIWRATEGWGEDLVLRGPNASALVRRQRDAQRERPRGQGKRCSFKVHEKNRREYDDNRQ